MRCYALMVITAFYRAMLHSRTASQPFEQACHQLEQACSLQGYGILASHNVGDTLRSKGFAFEDAVKVYEICHPGHAAALLAAEPALAAALPCRIAVGTHEGATLVSLISPLELLTASSPASAVRTTAEQVERDTLAILAAAAA